MDRPPRRLLPGYEPSDQSPSSSAAASPSSSSNNNPPPVPTSKPSAAAPSSSSSTTATTSTTRRQVTSLACNECRRVKCKCDGERPTCGLCERKGLVCDYDVGPRGRTALMALRHQYSLLETENNQLRELLRLIATLPPTDASEVLGRLRTNEDPLRVLQMVQAARLLMADSGPSGENSGEGSSITSPTTMPMARQQIPDSNTRPSSEPSLVTRDNSDEKPKPTKRTSGSSSVQSDLRMILNEQED